MDTIPRKTFCYHVRDYVTNQKLVGGMLHAHDLEDAAKRAAKTCKLTVETQYKDSGFDQYHFVRKGKKVYLYVSVHPENHGLVT